MVYDNFTTDAASGVLYDIQDLIGHQLINDRLEAFMSRWDTIIINLHKEPANDVLQALVEMQMRNSVKNLTHAIFSSCHIPGM